MATPPTFAVGQTLTSAQMNAVGLWLVKSQTIGSGVSSINVTSCFSSDFDNYVISLAGISASASMSVSLALLSGTTPTSSGWYGTEFYTPVGTTSMVGQLSANNSGAAYCSAGSAASGVASIIDIESPFLAQQTRFEYRCSASDYFRHGYALLQNTNSYNGIQITTTGGTTVSGGTISIYGRRK